MIVSLIYVKRIALAGNFAYNRFSHIGHLEHVLHTRPLVDAVLSLLAAVETRTATQTFRCHHGRGGAATLALRLKRKTTLAATLHDDRGEGGSHGVSHVLILHNSG